MIAYLGKSSVKKFYLDRVRAHRKADELVKGQYWEEGKGCAVGCTIHSGNHVDYETLIGVPRELARLEDVHFERLENGDAQLWPERFLSAIRVGADLHMVWPRYARWMLEVLPKTKNNKRANKSIASVLALYAEWCESGVQPGAGRFAAASTYAAASAAYSAAAAYYAAAASATYSADAASTYSAAAYYAAYATTYAADSAADSAAYSADARRKWWNESAEKLLELLAAA